MRGEDGTSAVHRHKRLAPFDDPYVDEQVKRARAAYSRYSTMDSWPLDWTFSAYEERDFRRWAAVRCAEVLAAILNGPEVAP